MQLLALLKAGDTLAFTELYNRYKQDIYRYGIAIVKLPYLAEDIVHDVFVKLWDGRQSINVHTQFRSYLLRICHNRSIDINKKIAADRELTNQLVHYVSSVREDEASSQEELQRYEDLVREALDTLTPQRRKIYEMCKTEKMTYEEVARELNISRHTVKTHISQTLSLLRTYIIRHGNVSLLLILVEKIF